MGRQKEIDGQIGIDRHIEIDRQIDRQIARQTDR